MTALLTPEHHGPRPRFYRETPGTFSYVLVDRDCDHVLGTDGTLLTLCEAAIAPLEVQRFDRESAARAEIAEQSMSMFCELRMLRKRVAL